MPSGADGAAQLGVQRLDRVRRINDAAHTFGEGEERDHLVPVPAPAEGYRGVPPTPMAGLEYLERRQARLGRFGAVDTPERLRDRLAILPRRKAHGVAEQMNDAGLDDGLREHRVDRLGEALEAVDDRDQDIADS